MPQTMLYMLNPGTYLLTALKKKKFRTIVFKLGKTEGSINRMKRKQNNTEVTKAG